MSFWELCQLQLVTHARKGDCHVTVMACSGVQGVASTFAFLLTHSIPNTPCLIKNAIGGWKAAKDWVINGDINTKALKELFGEIGGGPLSCQSYATLHC